MDRRCLKLRTAWIPAVVVLLCLLGGGCRSKDAAPGVNWAAMTPDRDYPLGSISIGELEKQVGFKLALPSYLPEGVSGDYRANLETYPKTMVSDSYTYASISLSAVYRRTSILSINLTEQQRQPGEPPRRQPTPTVTTQVTTIGHTTVECDLGPAFLLVTPLPFDLTLSPAIATALAGAPTFPPPPTQPPALATISPEHQPYLNCEWNTEELDISVEFRWILAEAVPGLITSDMRNEAMKVVTSMIKDPYIP